MKYIIILLVAVFITSSVTFDYTICYNKTCFEDDYEQQNEFLDDDIYDEPTDDEYLDDEYLDDELNPKYNQHDI